MMYKDLSSDHETLTYLLQRMIAYPHSDFSQMRTGAMVFFGKMTFQKMGGCRLSNLCPEL
jgi:hypothetical protein